MAHLSDAGTREEKRRHSEGIVRKHSEMFKQAVAAALEDLEARAADQLENRLQMKIRKGAQDGRQQAVGTVGEWNTHSNYHHGTYKGMVRRDGVWQHHTRGNLDWPEELAGPVYDRFTTDWRALFGQDLPAMVSDMREKIKKATSTLHNGLATDLASAGCRTKTQVNALQRGIDLDWLVARRCNELIEQVRGHGVDVTGCVQDQVRSELRKTSAACRDQRYAFQKEFIRSAATKINFEESAMGLVRGLSFVTEAVQECRCFLESELMRKVDLGYKPLWRKLTAAELSEWKQMKAHLLPQLEKFAAFVEADAQTCEKLEAGIQTELLQLMPKRFTKKPVGKAFKLNAKGLTSWGDFLRGPAPKASGTEHLAKVTTMTPIKRAASNNPMAASPTKQVKTSDNAMTTSEKGA